MKKCAGFLLILLAACNTPDDKVTATKPEYFALQPYFEQEASRLQKSSPLVHKTVVVNGTPESRNLKIASWTKELASFIEADINKNAWRGEFKKTVQPGAEIYTSVNEKVPVKRLVVYRKAKQISGVEILIENNNFLYTSRDTLSYFPDKRYEVKKAQQIKFMKEKKYRITGSF